MAEHVDDAVRNPNPMQKVSNAANEWAPSTFITGSSNPRGYLHQISASGE
jgi:hypothetical protein